MNPNPTNSQYFRLVLESQKTALFFREMDFVRVRCAIIGCDLVLCRSILCFCFFLREIHFFEKACSKKKEKEVGEEHASTEQHSSIAAVTSGAEDELRRSGHARNPTSRPCVDAAAAECGMGDGAMCGR